MDISPASAPPLVTMPLPMAAAGSANGLGGVDQLELRGAFDAFVGQTFYGQMLSALRKTVSQPAYFHGGRAEELFCQHLDQALAERLAASSADEISGPMFELFNLQRR